MKKRLQELKDMRSKDQRLNMTSKANKETSRPKKYRSKTDLDNDMEEMDRVNEVFAMMMDEEDQASDMMKFGNILMQDWENE